MAAIPDEPNQIGQSAISFELGEGDFLAFYRELCESELSKVRRAARIGIPVVILLSIGVVASSAWHGTWPNDDVPSSLDWQIPVLLVVALFLFPAVLATSARQVRKKPKRIVDAMLQGHGGAQVLGRESFSITPIGINVQRDSLDARCGWKYVTNIWHNDNHLWIDSFIGHFLIPRRAFDTKEGFLAFAQTAIAHWRSSASPEPNCPSCGYHLRGVRGAGCPECGWGRVASESATEIPAPVSNAVRAAGPKG